MREPKRKIIHPDKIGTNKIETLTNDWTNIPFYPTSEKKKEMIQKYGENAANEIIQYSYENSTDPTKEVLPPSISEPKQHLHQQQLLQIQKYNEYMRLLNASMIPKNINKYSPAYSRIIGAKPKATASANIRLGGVYH